MKTVSSPFPVALAGAVLFLGSCGSPSLQPNGPSDAARAGASGSRARAMEASARAAKPAAGASAVVTASMAFPTGDPRTSALQVDQLIPREVVLGEEFEVQLRATNLTEHRLDDVAISEAYGDNLEIVESSIELESSAGRRIWRLGDLEPNESKVVNLTASARKAERIDTCLSVTYDTSLCASIPVVEPALEISARGPAAALSCDPLVYRYVVTNTGTGTAEGVSVRIDLPDGLTDAEGRRTITRNLGALGSGKSSEFTLEARATKTGEFEHSASATGAYDLKAKSEVVATTVVRPALEISMTGTDRAFTGRSLSYQIAVKNTGTGVAQDVQLESELPPGLGFASAALGGRQFGNKVQWSLGDLPPGGSAGVTLKLDAESIGTFVNRSTARGYCAEPVSASSTTQVTGIPAILLEVVDVADPIAVGQIETYVITVTNQGSAPDTNIKVTVTMPENTEFVSADGTTQAMAGAGADGKISLAAIGTLAPKAKAAWQVRLRGAKAADARFHVSMISDQLSSPVTETEATNYYE
jgi:uncharacterized repeat protein (TIGR01451 family)